MIKGLVQGIGFRPFIYRLAAKHGLLGEVDNRTDGVSVIVQGDLKVIKRFSKEILLNAPSASQIKKIEIFPAQIAGYENFQIVKSKTFGDSITEVSPDIAVCKECLQDICKDPDRYNYPFTNCTNCGPRFTIIENLPYDRPNTTMKDFMMCKKCRSEYENILDRRFHAQPVACNSCGPSCILAGGKSTITDMNSILKEVSLRIASGGSVAVKGLGGYFLMCDALSEKAVNDLRIKKQRDAKPFAVMFRDIAAVRKYCYINEMEENELTSWRRPVVILQQKKMLSYPVNNGLGTTGAMLPYMPLHYIMFRYLQTSSVVLTSGNLSDEPIVIDDNDARRKLLPVTGSLLTYNRLIHNRADDSVVRIADNKIIILRRSRGFVPRPVELKYNVDGILATGAEQKNCFCIGKDNQAILSQHVGDLDNSSTSDFYYEAIERFSALFRFKPLSLACDLHPDYFSTHFAEGISKKLDIPLTRIQHHHAHIVSCMAEYGLDEKVIGVGFDGTGYGTDGNIWGSEFMIADLKGFERYSHFGYMPLPGGEKAVSEPWRMALSYLFKYYGRNFDYQSVPCLRKISLQNLILIQEMIETGTNCPLSSGAGRLFDAVAAILGICEVNQFDSEAPMLLESVIDCETDDFYPFSIEGAVNFYDTIKAIIEDIRHVPVSLISAKFHNTVAQTILTIAGKIRKRDGLDAVILSGGVFQNKYLVEKVSKLLRKENFRVFTNQQVPPNDGGLALGQLVIASKTIK